VGFSAPFNAVIFSEKGVLMRNVLIALTAFCVGSALVGCNSNSVPVAKPQESAPKKDQQVALGWTLKYQAQCPEEIDATECVGAYNFSILTNGNWEIGPGPNNEVRRGILTQDQLSAISTLLAPSLSGTGIRTEGHDSIEAVENKSEETLTFVKGSENPIVLVKATGTELSFQTQTADEAKSLLSAVREIAKLYYIAPFPDECKDGANSLQILFDSMQTCTSNSDCTYLNTSFESITPNSSEELIIDDCSIVKPLVVGNASSISGHEASLLESLDNIRAACGDNMIRSDCTSATSFTLTGAAPVCDQGVCKLNSNQ
jgi:hypothetical protein